MSSIEKQCVLCGESCVGQPRIKNEKGQYAHRACAEAQQKNKQHPEPAPDPELAALGFDDDGFGDMSDLLPDTPIEHEQPAMRSACPSCGTALAQGNVVCMNCGYNTQSGKAIKTKAKDQAAPNAGGAMVAGAASKAGGLTLLTIMPIVGASVAGAIGAAIWAAIAYFAHLEIGWVAIGVGALVGLGALIGARNDGNLWVGCVAAVIAVASILAGKYAVVSIIYDKEIGGIVGEVATNLIVDETWILQDIVDDLAYERIDSGKPIIWPDPSMTIEFAEWPNDYPRDLQAAARAQWDKFSPEEQQQQIDERQAEMDEIDFGELESAIKKEGFIATFGMFDLVWLFFAVCAAYTVGAQED